MASAAHSRILILDFGSQYTQLIARRVREAHVYCEIHPYDVGDDFIRAFGATGHHPVRRAQQRHRGRHAARAGGGLGERGAGARHLLRHADDGAQLGGAVESGKVREFGYAEVRARGHSALLRGIEDRRNAEGHGLLDVWMSHGDKVTALPPGFKVIASNDACPIAGMADEARRFYARAVPSRGHAHDAGHGDPRPLRARDLRLRRRTGTWPTTSPRRSRRSARRSARTR